MGRYVCLCLQSEWFILGLPSWGYTLGGTVSVYSTGIPSHEVVLKILAVLARVISEGYHCNYFTHIKTTPFGPKYLQHFFFSSVDW